MRRSGAVIEKRGDAWWIRGPLGVRGTLAPPGDKSIAHRAQLLAALGRGTSELRGIPDALDVLSTLTALESLGVPVERRGDVWRVHGAGLRGLHPSAAPIDCGNSGTTMRLLSGVLAAQPFPSLLCGDASLSRRPMRRIAEPLRAMGASIECLGEGERPPLRIAPPRAGGLLGVAHTLSVDSAQVRGAILLAGVHAEGPTRIHPVGAARDHTERMLRALGVCIRSNSGGIELFPTQPGGWRAGDFSVPGDPSAAAFFAAAAAGTAGSALRVERVGLNPGRIRCFEILRSAGSAVHVQPRGESMGEPWGEVEVRGRLVRPLRLAGDDVVQCIDEIPALLVAAALAGVGAELRDAAELRVKESDRLAAMSAVLAAFGARVQRRRDGLRLEPGARLRPARVDSGGDHRIAMAAAILAAGASGESCIRGVDCVRTSYPNFAADFHRLAHRAGRNPLPAPRAHGTGGPRR